MARCAILQKKNSVVFQNSATRTVPVYGTVSFDLRRYSSQQGDYFVFTNKSSYALRWVSKYGTYVAPPNGSATGPISRYDYVFDYGNVYVDSTGAFVAPGTSSFNQNIVVGSRTETYWNTKWRKLSA